MPELPEVETIRRGLAGSLEGAKILKVTPRRVGLRYPFPPQLQTHLLGKTVTGLARRAKYLLFLCEKQVIISHLGMSGSWRIDLIDEADKKPNRKHDHLIIDMNCKGRYLRAIYHDPRRFGFILLTSLSELETHPNLKNLGLEPLSNALSPATLAPLFRNKKAPLKTALLDQRLIAGLGNIYVCEALWQAKLSPFLSTDALAADTKQAFLALTCLIRAIRDVLTRALVAGGSTLRDYAHTDGTQGYFQHQFNVYDHETAPCPRCGTAISRTIQSGRSTFYCANCQPLQNFVL